ncbi:MAG: HpnM family protein [Candidatus Nitrosoglobus sp.]|jgi:phospholipid transport system substrate-binding protein
MKQVLIKAMLVIFMGIIFAVPPALAELESESPLLVEDSTCCCCQQGLKPPSLTIEKLNATLLSVMKEAKELGFEGRYQRLLPIITQEFDLPFIARYTLGSSWDELNNEQRNQFIETFQELSVTDYARHFDDYSGQHFTIEGEASLPRSGMRVRSKLIDPNGSNVIFDYLLRKVDNQWRIVNVIANGVSDLAVKRAEYRQIIKTEGFNSLLTKLREKIALYRH